MVRFWCQCGRQLKASERLAGEMMKCPLCRRLLFVPEHDLPRTADFPPVPPRGSVNACGEITRTVQPAAVVPDDAKTDEEPVVRPAWAAWLVVVLALCAAGVAAYFAWPINRASWLLVALALLAAGLAVVLGLSAMSRRAARDGEPGA
jgi:hypothetical protein